VPRERVLSLACRKNFDLTKKNFYKLKMKSINKTLIIIEVLT